MIYDTLSLMAADVVLPALDRPPEEAFTAETSHHTIVAAIGSTATDPAVKII